MNVQQVTLRSGTTSEWAASTLVLGAGELGLNTTTGIIKIGTGSGLFAAKTTAFAAPVAVAVTGDRSDGTALTNLLTALASAGYITDSTTA